MLLATCVQASQLLTDSIIEKDIITRVKENYWTHQLRSEAGLELGLKALVVSRKADAAVHYYLLRVIQQVCQPMCAVHSNRMVGVRTYSVEKVRCLGTSTGRFRGREPWSARQSVSLLETVSLTKTLLLHILERTIGRTLLRSAMCATECRMFKCTELLSVVK
jgi:hypothetical protein